MYIVTLLFLTNTLNNLATIRKLTDYAKYIILIRMNREDLAGQCDKRNLDVFRGEFDF